MRKRILLPMMLGAALCACHPAPPQQAPMTPLPIQAVGVESPQRGDLLAHALLVHRFAADDVSGVLDTANVTADKTISADGHGSLKISVPTPDTKTIALYEVDNPPSAAAGRFVYRLKLRTDKSFSGQAFVELSARLTDSGDYLPRSIANGIQGGSQGAWVTLTSPFYMQSGDPSPKSLRLSLTLTGPATVWVDDVDLLQAPLH